jgi:hypothetical protein
MGKPNTYRNPIQEGAQRDEILRLLREAKARGQGVNKAVLVFECRYTQCATRIFELEKQGFKIEHRSIPGERFVTFFLVSEPAAPKPVTEWKDRQRVTGLPLFDSGVRVP